MQELLTHPHFDHQKATYQYEFKFPNNRGASVITDFGRLEVAALDDRAAIDYKSQVVSHGVEPCGTIADVLELLDAIAAEPPIVR